VIKPSLRIASIFLIAALVQVAQAQLTTSLRLSKRQYLAGEPVIAVVTITNHAGRELTFYGNGRQQWLNFIVKDGKGEAIMSKGTSTFGKMTIQPGESLAREVNLAQHFHLGQQGNFSVSAVVHMPDGMGEGSSTNRVVFNQSPGLPYWTQKVGIPSKPGQTREFRLLNFSGEQKAQLYAQVVDGRTGQSVWTFVLGEVLMLRKPLATVDGKQRMHVLFLVTPTMWVHCQVDTDGKLVERQIHQRGPDGDPQLLTFGDGTVQVSNSIPYDQKAAAEAKAKVRKASDRPQATY
jgi:hypothetical protein